jgi:hypothetical protein
VEGAVSELDVFAGRWHVEGTAYSERQQIEDPLASATSWRSDETYAWMPGGCFLMHHWDAAVGLQPSRGTEILGHDDETGFFAHQFDDRGTHRTYRVAHDGPIWTFVEPETRATITVGSGGARLDIVWQWKHDGTEWLPLCDRVALRTG